jgi:chromosome partitioning protein
MKLIISVFNQKGGVAKTTTTSNLGAYLARHGKKVLLVDMDAQANLTSSVGLDDDELDVTIHDLLKNQEFKKERILEVITETHSERLYILPTDITLSDAEIELSTFMSRETILKRILQAVRSYFDYIIIDCPPNLGLMSVNSLAASEYLIIPIAPSFFSVKGIKHLVNTYKMIKKNLNPELDILGILLTKYDSRKNISKDIRTNLINAFDNKVFTTVIRDDVKIEYSQENQKPIIYYYEKCRSCDDYVSFGKEVLQWAQKAKEV